MAVRPQKVGLKKGLVHGVPVPSTFTLVKLAWSAEADPISPRPDINVRGLEEACTFLLSTSDQIQKRTPLEAGNIAHFFTRTFKKMGKQKTWNTRKTLRFLGVV